MIRRRHAAEAGFTLIELLVAVTLAALLTMLIFGGTRFAARAWSTADRRTGAAADLWAVRGVLRRTIAGAYPAFASVSRSDRTIAFDGEADRLALVSPLPQAIAAGVEARTRFLVVTDGRSRALVMGWRLDLPAAGEGDSLPDHQVRLLDRVRSVRFAYFGPSAAGGAPAWLNRWSGRTRLPELVRIRIVRDDPGLPGWPDLVVATRATLNSACVYYASLARRDAQDVLATGCRKIR